MPWIKHTPPAHQCFMPVFIFVITPGDIWECEECGQWWLRGADHDWFKVDEVTRKRLVEGGTE